MLQKIRGAYETAKGYVKDLATHTKAEIIVGAIAGAIVLGAVGHTKETQRSAFQPVSFSEYEQIEDKAIKEGRELNHLTWFYAGVNDFSGKIAEAYNSNSIWATIPGSQQSLTRPWTRQGVYTEEIFVTLLE